MNQSSHNDASGNSSNGLGASDTAPEKSKLEKPDRITLPIELPGWLTKRVELSVPVWVIGIVSLALALLIFD